MKPLTNAVICAVLFSAVTLNIAGSWTADAASLQKLRQYAAEADTNQDRYDSIRAAWVSIVGDDLFASEDFKTFATEQAELARKEAADGREEAEQAALDGFAYPWNRSKAKTLLPKVREADEIHAANSGLNYVVVMATATCDGTILTKDQYEDSGLDDAASIRVYRDVVKLWRNNDEACSALEKKLSALS